MAKKLSEMSDEERYGKVGAQIRRLDPEAYKNRPRSAEGNLKLLKELQGRSKTTPARTMSPDEFMSPASRRRTEETSTSSSGPSTRGGRRASPEQTEATNKRIKDTMVAQRASEAIKRNRPNLPSDRATNFRTQAEETGMTPDERAEKAREYSKNIAMTAGAAALGGAAASPYRLTSGAFRKAADKASEAAGRSLSRKGVPSFSERYAAREAAAEQRAAYRARKEAEKKLDEKLSADMAGGYKRGGSVKSSASRRADGIAKRGKTRGKYV